MYGIGVNDNVGERVCDKCDEALGRVEKRERVRWRKARVR